MPCYEYHCPVCSGGFEVIRRFSFEGLETCPHCNSEISLKYRVVGRSTFNLKGTGWERDSYSGGNVKYNYQD